MNTNPSNISKDEPETKGKTRENNELNQPNNDQVQIVSVFWKKNIRLTLILLFFWVLFSLGFGILFRNWLDQIFIGGAPLGFWFAQQGAIYAFLIIILIYNILIERIERHYHLSDGKD